MSALCSVTQYTGALCHAVNANKIMVNEVVTQRSVWSIITCNVIWDAFSCHIIYECIVSYDIGSGEGGERMEVPKINT